MVSGEMDADEAEQAARDLLTYCGLDTSAMVEIWRMLARTITPMPATG